MASRGTARDNQPSGALIEPSLAPKGVVSVGSVLVFLVDVDFCASVLAVALLVTATSNVVEGVAAALEEVVAVSASSLVDAGPFVFPEDCTAELAEELAGEAEDCTA